MPDGRRRGPLNTLATVDFVHRDDVYVARVDGEIDMSNAEEIREALISVVPNSAMGLVLDLSGIMYLDSTGIRVVFDLAERLRRRQQQLRLAVPEAAPPRRMLTLADVGQAAPIHPTVDEGVARIRQGPGNEIEGELADIVEELDTEGPEGQGRYTER